MTGGIPFGFGFGPVPMPGPVDVDPRQMQFDEEQQRALAARLIGAQMFHPANGAAAMEAPGDQGLDPGPGQSGGQGAPMQAPTSEPLLARVMPIPNASPGDAAAFGRQAPYDPSDAPPMLRTSTPIVPTGSPDGGSVQGGPQFPANTVLASALGGMPSMTAGQMPSPQMPTPQAPQPQQAPAAPSPVDALLFDRAGMGAPDNGFSGSSGTIAEPQSQSAARSRGVLSGVLPAPQATGSVPQAAPAPAGGEPSQPAPSAAPASPGRTPPTAARPPEPDASMQPVSSFDPLTGQPVSGSPQPVRGEFDPLTGQPVSAAPRPAQIAGPQGAPSSAPTAATGNPITGFLSGLSRPGVSEGLLALGAGILQGKNFGEGLGQGLQNMLAVSQRQGAGDAQRLEYALKLQKAQQEQAGQNLTAQRLIQLGEDPENVRAAIGASMAGRPEALQNMLNNRFRKTPDAPSGYRQTDGGGLEPIAGGPADLKRIEDEARAREKDETQTPLTTPEARAAAGISADDDRAAWKDPNGKVTFTDGPKETALIREWQQAKRENGYTGTLQQYRQEQQGPRFITVKGPNGETVTKRYNPQTGQAEDIPGAAPPAADNSGIPPGVDPGTYRKESAKAAVAEQKANSQRAQQASAAMPILERAQAAYERLAQNGGIGPYQASGVNRAIGGMAGRQNEIDRQEFEAASKELELLQAQIKMKGQGAISENERRILQMTLPRLDAASPETGLNTLRAMREQFIRAGGVSSGGGGGGGQGHGQAPAQPQGQQGQNAAASRYQQLRRGGMSQADAYARMQQEGY